MGAKSSAGAGRRAAGSSPSATSAPFASANSGGQPRRLRFPRARKLLKRKEFQRVYDQGSRITSPYFAMFCLRRDDAAVQGVRVGFTTPRALGKATVRNRVRRRLREAVRLRLGEVTAAVDLVFQPRRNVLTADWQTLQREVERVLGKCGI